MNCLYGTEREEEVVKSERTMANRNLEKMASIDAQLRLLVPRKVSEDDKLIEYDALLLDRFLDILQDLHGEDLKETVSFFFKNFCHKWNSDCLDHSWI